MCCQYMQTNALTIYCQSSAYTFCIIAASFATERIISIIFKTLFIKDIAKLRNLGIKTYHVLAVFNVLLRGNANQPFKMRAKVTLTGKSSSKGYFLN
jgi:hypothetical protein